MKRYSFILILIIVALLLTSAQVFAARPTHKPTKTPHHTLTPVPSPTPTATPRPTVVPIHRYPGRIVPTASGHCTYIELGGNVYARCV